ncbi:hypothetical protein MNB_SV-10-641 [hydrothermal vent metagenome]|uniref:Uncharacterized protein n=1 Tax=hydrothermal vent metagenome TaxID=652676 RepID=A0A1W1BH93_9ZZZZ
MFYVLMTKIRFFLIGFLLVCSFANASESYMSDFAVSAKIDSKTALPIDIRKRFPADIKRVWASVRIHNPQKHSKIKMIWYQGSQKLMQSNLEGEADIRLYAASLARKEKYLFPIGKFRVDFILDGVRQGSASFEIVATQKKQRIAVHTECIKPTRADNKLLIDDSLKKFPEAKAFLNELKLRRFHDRGKHFSLLAPSGWKAKKETAENTYLYLSREYNKSATTYILRKIPLDEKQRSRIDKETIVKAISTMLMENALKNSAEILQKARIYPMPDLTTGSFSLVYKNEKVPLYELHTLLYDGAYLYDVVLVTDERGLEISKFLLLLAAYSFWTQESCR